MQYFNKFIINLSVIKAFLIIVTDLRNKNVSDLKWSSGRNWVQFLIFNSVRFSRNFITWGLFCILSIPQPYSDRAFFTSVGEGFGGFPSITSKLLLIRLSRNNLIHTMLNLLAESNFHQFFPLKGLVFYTLKAVNNRSNVIMTSFIMPMLLILLLTRINHGFLQRV